MDREILPPGSLVLLSLISISGLMTWWTNNFTKRTDLVKIFATVGIASMISLLVLVFVD
tara:strand:- start:424 stop:600 length:177 start_codon:yes stop_codon:yes gene_type:complete